MINELYTKYFQKSSAFLYPLLKIDKNKHPKPLQTYIRWDNIVDVKENKLLCLYRREDNDAWRTFEKNVLMPHNLLETTLELSNNRVLYEFNFDLEFYKQAFIKFVEGKYSEFPKQAKLLIADYFGLNTPEWVYIESYIHPAKYYSIYAQIMKVSKDSLISKVELCNTYDSQQESCPLEINEVLN